MIAHCVNNLPLIVNSPICLKIRKNSVFKQSKIEILFLYSKDTGRYNVAKHKIWL